MKNEKCIYTICHNNSKFIDNWVNAVRNDGQLFAIVHDTKDDSIEKFIEYGVKVVTTHYQNFDQIKAETDALNWAKMENSDCSEFTFVPIDKFGESDSPDRRIQNPKENKICVYTTCYNESKFIDKWLENNIAADHIVVLVHDCKDDSEEKFKKAKNNISIAHGFYNEWRFDNGKNDSMHFAYALAPECNIFVFTALDEYWDKPDWADVIKSNWVPGETQRCWYNFVQTHDEFGNEGVASYFNWMISKDPKWHWEYPIHEAIIYGNSETVNNINLFNKLKLQHWPDEGKTRNYMNLHKLRYEEYKDDISYLYLIRETIICNRLKEAYDLTIKYDHEKSTLVNYENAYIWVLEGICCEHLNMYDKAVEAYRKAWEKDGNLRSPMLRAAIVYAKCGAYKKAEQLINKALTETVRAYSWLDDPSDWRSKPYFWLSYINMKLGQKEKALGYALFANQIDPTEENEKQLQKVLETA